MDLSIGGLLENIAKVVVAVVGPWVVKKMKDRDLREAIAAAADAALVLAIKKMGGTVGDVGQLLRLVVEGIVDDPNAPKQVRKNQTLAERAAAAAIARNTVLAPKQ